jgi:hypothetical protein
MLHLGDTYLPQGEVRGEKRMGVHHECRFIDFMTNAVFTTICKISAKTIQFF